MEGPGRPRLLFSFVTTSSPFSISPPPPAGCDIKRKTVEGNGNDVVGVTLFIQEIEG